MRARGSDAAAGDLALAAGTVLGPPQIGLLAAIGRGTVTVRPRPRVVVLSTGSELVQPGTELGPGRIYDSNGFALAAAARDAGAIAYRVGAVTDDADELRAAIEDQLVRADLLVTTGGVSVGAYDVVKEALSAASDADEPGGGVEFRTLAMQPGKPQGFGSVGPGHTPLLALPGNPVSSYVSFELFARPAIRALMGLPDLHRPRARAVLSAAGPLPSPAGKRQFLRGTYDPGRVPSLLWAVPVRTWSRPSPGRTRSSSYRRTPRAWSPGPRWRSSSSAEPAGPARRPWRYGVCRRAGRAGRRQDREAE